MCRKINELLVIFFLLDVSLQLLNWKGPGLKEGNQCQHWSTPLLVTSVSLPANFRPTILLPVCQCTSGHTISNVILDIHASYPSVPCMCGRDCERALSLIIILEMSYKFLKVIFAFSNLSFKINNSES